jgi:hypothetical protein
MKESFESPFRLHFICRGGYMFVLIERMEGVRGAGLEG